MRIAILGFGSVGRGIAQIIAEKNLGLTITAIADSKSGCMDSTGIDPLEIIKRKEDTGLCGEKGITAEYIIQNAEYDALVEVTPTNAETAEPSLGYIRLALSEGRHVVTSNKGPIALNYNELKELAEENGICLKFEATVCGAIPIIQTLQYGLAGNRVKKLYGIFNGTCNYILTRMADEKLTYKEALLEARELGYAEADPTYDVEGIDAAIKLVILANTIFGINKRLEDVEITGINSLTSQALELAEEDELTIRLIGEINNEKGTLKVSPRVIPKDHTLVVHDTLNAVTIDTDLAGEITLIGKGAGSIETASAIISDLLFISNCHDRGP